MKRLLILPVCLFLCGSTAFAAQPPNPPQQFRPQWQIGQEWTVQTESVQQQVAVGQERVVTAQWQFQVDGVEPIQGQTCLRISVRPLQGGHVQDEPKTTVWVDQKTTSIRQIQTQMRTPQGYRTATESYKPGMQAAPIIGPLSILPIALPQFPEEGLKAMETFQYDTISGAGGIKAIGLVGFTTEIQQTFKQPSEEQIKSLRNERGIKDFGNSELVEVELSTADEKVQQVWGVNMPWPVFTDNGTTKATLVAVGSKRSGQPLPAENAAPTAPAETAAPDDDGVKAMNRSGAVEQAQSTIRPWSGYWWPIQEGELVGPLAKYDALTGHQAADWEEQHNPSGPNVPRWFGYCHAWAAASVLEGEPNKKRSYPAGEDVVALTVGDQKGLLTACHTEDLANSWGDRFGDGEGSEDPQDLSPDRLWRLLQMHIAQQKVPLIVDVEAGKEVWNYPVYAYVIRYKPAEDDLFLADLTLLMADDAVSPSHRGTKIRKQTCQFTFKMRGGNVLAGSSKWVGASRKDHPDFAWYPYKAVATNPEIHRPEVLELVSSGTTPDDSPSATSSPALPTAPPTTSSTPSTPSTPTTPPTTPTAPPAGPSANPADATEPASRPGAVSVNAQQEVVEPPTGPIVVSPLELAALVANKTSSFEFDVMLDRFDGSTYGPGETFFVRVKSSKAGYLYLLQVDSTGTPALLYPTAGEDNRIPADKLLDIKPKNAAGGFPVIGPAGIVRVKAVVTSRPLTFSGSLDPLPTQTQQQQGRMQPQTPQQTAQRQRRKPRQEQPVQQPERQEQPDQSAQAQATPVPFRWHPTQQHQIQELLSAAEQLSAEQIGCRSPQEILGAFAQDVTTFYVDTKAPAEKSKSKTSKKTGKE